ncbi:MAG: hypothetical protein FJ027_20010 [Candidatus Rokubacteria bacterium]|nr:hypothetical protein [Candidatus Rokubacteria bacterium]
MKKAKRVVEGSEADDMRAEYDFSNGKRGAVLKHFPPGAIVIALDDDVRTVFSTAEMVNEALRTCTAPKSRPNARAKRKRTTSAGARVDVATGRRGSLAERFPTGITLVALETDVEEKFRTAVSANRALRELMKRKRAAQR